MSGSIASEVDEVYGRLSPVWPSFDGARIFITGATGFYGRWVLESLVHAIERGGFRAELLILTRSRGRFENQTPHLARHVRVVEGDVRTFAPPAGALTHVLHLAGGASPAQREGRPLEVFDTIVSGTRRVMEFSAKAGARHALFASSGAVYGRQPADIAGLAEDSPARIAVGDPRATYAVAKSAAEQLCALIAAEVNMSCALARGFAFLGPHLPLDAGFAAADFIRSALANQPIQVRGDGTAVRSYLYATDLTVWLLSLLARVSGCEKVNVGSEEPTSIGALAQLTARLAAEEGLTTRVEIARAADPNAAPERYVPSCARAQDRYGLAQTVTTEEAVRRTLRFHLGRSR